jgi:glycosyltransferase involved in cell wall biosynthesis
MPAADIRVVLLVRGRSFADWQRTVTVFIVAPSCPHPFGDTAAKWFDVLVRELVRRGHHVTLLCVTEEPASRIEAAQRALAEIASSGRLDVTIHSLAISRPAWRRKLASLREPFSEIRQADGVRQLVEERLSRGYDVFHLEQLWTGWLAAGVPRSVINVHHLEVIDMEGEPAASLAERKARWQMRRATTAITEQAKHIRFFTQRLSDRARAYNRSARHWVIPFALDSAHYDPVTLSGEPVVGLIGSMQWGPSRSAAERLITKIWPRVRLAMPSARLLIAGWQADQHLAHYGGMPGLDLRANISHPREFFAEAGVLAYTPRRGSGMKIKVMEAMAYGVPVVTTTEGIEGLQVESGRHAHVADDDETLAEMVVGVLRDRGAASRMAREARALIVEQHSPAVVVDRIIDMYQAVTA